MLTLRRDGVKKYSPDTFSVQFDSAAGVNMW